MGKIILDKERCLGCGACCSIAEENFTFDDEGKASLINDTITDNAIEASTMCPTGAITIEHNCNCNDDCTCGENCNCTKDNCCCDNCNCN